MHTVDRSDLCFSENVREHFTFLEKLGFSETESSPTIVRYKKGDVEVDIYHGRLSYEIGAGVAVSGERYSISEIVRASDPESYEHFRYAMTRARVGVAKAVEELSDLMRRVGGEALAGDNAFVNMLAEQREQWSKDYALDVLAEQLRPKASEAFRQRDYLMAANLYSRIRECLSNAELKKADYAIRHSKTK